jgi:hypothetical protein
VLLGSARPLPVLLPTAIAPRQKSTQPRRQSARLASRDHRVIPWRMMRRTSQGHGRCWAQSAAQISRRSARIVAGAKHKAAPTEPSSRTRCPEESVACCAPAWPMAAGSKMRWLSPRQRTKTAPAESSWSFRSQPTIFPTHTAGPVGIKKKNKKQIRVPPSPGSCAECGGDRPGTGVAFISPFLPILFLLDRKPDNVR